MFVKQCDIQKITYKLHNSSFSFTKILKWYRPSFVSFIKIIWGLVNVPLPNLILSAQNKLSNN
jgi:hypothetical protein